jgi:hypothetical protein
MKQPYILLILSILTALIYQPLPAQNIITNSFSQKTENSRSRYIIPLIAYSCAAGDLDQDGDNDIVIGHNYSSITNWSGVSIMLNDGFGYFELFDSIYLYGGQSDILFLNLNNQASMEIATKSVDVEQEIENIAIINDFNLSNISEYTLNTNQGVSYKTSGDVNGDSYLDIVMASHQGQFWGMMYNNGNGQLSKPYYLNVSGYYPSAIACGDLNEDGRDDVVVCGQSTEVYFSYPEGFESLLLEHSDFKEGAFVTDFDLDGDNDLLSFVGIPFINKSVVKIYENLGGGVLDTLDLFYFNGLTYKSFISDFNNDNLPDMLFILSNNSGLLLYYNLGDFQLGDSLFIPLESYGQYEISRDCCIEDFDGNGYNDIAIIRQSGIKLPDNLVVLFNDGAGNFGEDPITKINNPQADNNLVSFRCYPNPFDNETMFVINHSGPGNNLKLCIHDLHGVLINEFSNLIMDKNQHLEITWAGADKLGKTCTPGVYMVSLTANNKTINQVKLVKNK